MKRDAVPACIARLRAFDVEIDNNRLLPAPDHDCFARLIRKGIDFLMRNERRDIDEVTRPGFTAKFEVLTPSHSGPASDDIKYSFKFAVMMRAGLRIGLDDHGAGPELTRADAGVSDGGGSAHAGSLWRVRIEFAGANNTDPLTLPIKRAHSGRQPSEAS